MKKILLGALIGVFLVGCGVQQTSAPLNIPEETINTDIQSRLVNATGVLWEDGRMGETFPYGFIQRLMSTYPDECDIEVLVFRTNEDAMNAEDEVSGWGWTRIWLFEDPSTEYGIFVGEREADQSCTNDAASAFGMTLSR